MNCVVQVHEENIALPAEPCQDVVIRELLPVKLIYYCYMDGLCGPQLQLRVTLLQVQGGTGCFTQEWIDQCVRDESDLTTFVLEYCHGFPGFYSKLKRLMVDLAGQSYSTVRGAHGVVGESDLLPIVAVLLVPPDNDKVFDQALADFAAA